MDWKRVEYDAVIVGSGATGGMAAKCLTDGGANVLVLEAGPELSPEFQREREKSPEEFELIKTRQPVQSRSLLYNRRNCHLFIDDLDNPYTTDGTTAFNWIRSRQAGGRTPIWSRFALRMSDADLKSPNEDGFHGQWPICYRDLAPYYSKVEALLGVSGTVEGVSSLPDGCFLRRRVPEYLLALRQKLASRFPDRHLIPSREAAANEIGNIPVSDHSDPGATLTQHNRRNLTFRTNCVAARIELDRPNHAQRVVFIDRQTQRWYDVAGRVIVLCASTIESVRLLLASANRYFPTGLGNATGLLGRYLMDHSGGPRVVAVGKVQDAKPFSRERAYIPRFCNLSGRNENFIRGYGIQADLETDAHGKNAILTLGVFGEVLPYAENSVELDESTRDMAGLAVPKIRFRYRDNEQNMALHAQAALQEIVDALGFRPMITHDGLLAPGTRAHEVGGARMGSNANESVLNPFNQCWDVANLFVTDGSCFPSAGYKGPTLTMMALTARACDKILEMLRAGAV
jgi:choline dehydrogenase-like flavoprotein